MGTKSATFIARAAFFCGILALLTHGVCLVSVVSPYRLLDFWPGLLGLVCATLAFILGYIIRSDWVRRCLSSSTFSLGTAGQYLAGAWFIIAVLILAFGPDPGASLRAKVARTVADMWSIAAGLEAYHQDHEVYPPAVDESGKLIVLPDEGTPSVSAGYVPWLLTTPLAYLTELPSDLFHRSIDRKEMPFRYATNGTGCWILASNGPDEEINVKVSGFPEPEIGDCSEDRFMSHSGVGKVVLYDVSNGTISAGDIIRTGP